MFLNTPKIKTYHLCMKKFCKNVVVVFPIDTFQVFSTMTHCLTLKKKKKKKL